MTRLPQKPVPNRTPGQTKYRPFHLSDHSRPRENPRQEPRVLALSLWISPWGCCCQIQRSHSPQPARTHPTVNSLRPSAGHPIRPIPNMLRLRTNTALNQQDSTRLLIPSSGKYPLETLVKLLLFHPARFPRIRFPSSVWLLRRMTLIFPLMPLRSNHLRRAFSGHLAIKRTFPRETLKIA